MKFTPLQTIILLVILAGVIYGTYSATMDQLPDITGTVMGNTTNNANLTNNVIGTIYVKDTENKNTSVIITKETKIYKETEDNKQIQSDMRELQNNTQIEVHTIGDATNTIPPQIVSEKIIIKKVEKPKK